MQLIAQSVLRLVCVAALCLAATTLWVVDSAHESVVAATAASAERMAGQLENLYWRELLWRGSLRKTLILPVPEWETLETLKLISPGVCVDFAPGAAPTKRLCSQIEGVGAAAPAWFSRAFVAWFGAPPKLSRFMTVRQHDAGVLTVQADGQAAVRLAWREVSVVLRVAALMVIAVVLFGALALGHLLAPTRAIVATLRRLERGDYSASLPAFGVAEFGLIARAVEDLARRLSEVTDERIALTKRLFEVQEEERRALARDLHDEFGQNLTAATAFAASIEAGAQDRPDLAEDARAISHLARGMRATLRQALARLRAQELEELGLEASLARLIAGWNAKGERGPAFKLDVSGDLAGLPGGVAIGLYRVAQECLTNAARHGHPSEVRLSVARIAASGGGVALSVEDDGGGRASLVQGQPGGGVLGMRERVAALGGNLRIAEAPHGVRVEAYIPLCEAA
jgi:two-component system, NarL family, sensor histidine kinase UhpB